MDKDPSGGLLVLLTTTAGAQSYLLMRRIIDLTASEPSMGALPFLAVFQFALLVIASAGATSLWHHGIRRFADTEKAAKFAARSDWLDRLVLTTWMPVTVAGLLLLVAGSGGGRRS